MKAGGGLALCATLPVGWCCKGDHALATQTPPGYDMTPCYIPRPPGVDALRGVSRVGRQDLVLEGQHALPDGHFTKPPTRRRSKSPALYANGPSAKPAARVFTEFLVAEFQATAPGWTAPI
jgi:hypothetical protein